MPSSKKEQQSQKSDKNKFQSEMSNSKKKNKSESEQCELDENVKDAKIEIVSCPSSQSRKNR